MTMEINNTDSAMRSQLIEILAKKRYDSWKDQEGYLPWQDGGNSDKQHEARDYVRTLVNLLYSELFYPVHSAETIRNHNALVSVSVNSKHETMADWVEKNPTLSNVGCSPKARHDQNITGGSVENPKRATAVSDAMDILKTAMIDDPDYAWSWHCAIWSGCYDECHDTAMANRAASRVMCMAFDCNTENHENFNHEHKVAKYNFGDALAALRDGARVQRSGWNGKNMFVYLVPEDEYPAKTAAAKGYFGENKKVPYNPYFAIKNANETVSTWVPSVNDCLANDWIILQ